ncbi:MAG: phosphodiester glycosidase family protein [Mobilitalea sp.]
MKIKKKLLPVWLITLIDILLIASYVIGFYGIYYLSPRELASSNIQTVQAQVAAESTETSGTDTTGTDTSDIEVTDADSSKDTDATDADSSTDTETLSVTSDDLKAKFAEYFTDDVVSTSDSYSSSGISITVDQYTTGSGEDTVTYYVADIYLADITSLQSGFAEDTYGVGYTDTVLDMDESLNAILAMNGDYYGNGGDGVVIRNGEVYRSSTSDSDVCVLYYDGIMKTYSAEEFDVDQAIAEGAWQAWCFGPELLDDTGSSMTEFVSDGHVSSINPRSALGYYEPGHYCMVVVDGRQSGYSAGMTLTELSSLLEELGCTSAYNMDGGKSSSMTFDDAEVNQPTDGGREVSDCILIKEQSGDMSRGD